MHLIIDLDHWVHGLPLLGQSDKSPLSLKCVNVFQTVNLAIKIVFAIVEYDFPACCNVTIASLLSDVFESFKILQKII